MSRGKKWQVRKQKPSNKDFRNVEHVHVPKNKYNRQREKRDFKQLIEDIDDV